MLYKDYQNTSLDLYINQGSDFEQVCQLLDSDGTPLELTSDMTLSIVIKKYYNTFIFYPGSVESVPNSPGFIKIKIPSSTTSLFTASRYVYQVKIAEGSESICVLDGTIIVDRF